MKIRVIYFSIACVWGALALVTRSNYPMPELLATYGGDTLWAAMLYFLICALMPMHAGLFNLSLALLVSYSVETSQLYQAQWIREVRANRVGGLLLGHGFKVSDLLCYTVGNISACVLDVSARLHVIEKARAV